MELLYDSGILLLRIYWKKLKTSILKKISSPMFTAALSTIAKIGQQFKPPSVDVWIKRLWDIYTMEYYLAIKKKNFTLSDSMDGPGDSLG